MNKVRLYNDKLYQENLQRLEEETPPLPCESEDEEKKMEIVDEITVLEEDVQEKLDLSPVVPCSMLLP